MAALLLLAAAGLISSSHARVKSSADILKENNYPAKTYSVTTADGYILQLDRIPREGKTAVFVANPILSAAPIYLYLGRNYSLGYALYDAGFDVFLGNYRGTVYSRNHTYLSAKKDEFWKYSLDEHASLDNTAFIDFILDVTGKKDLLYVGFSLGSTVFFMMEADRTEYNKKVRAAFLLAPILGAYLTGGTLYDILHPIHNVTEVITDALSIHKVPDGLIRTVERLLCPNHAGLICNALLWFFFNSARHIDYVGNCPDLTSTWPAGASWREFFHYAQNTNYLGRFKKYSFGKTKNRKEYGSDIPPDYVLENVSSPVYLYTGDSDQLATEGDVQLLERRVKSFRKRWRHPNPKFSHADFVFARDTSLVNDRLIKDMLQFK